MSDSFLTASSNWLQWVAIVGTGLGLISSIGLFFVRTELSDRQAKRLAAAQQEATQARGLAATVEGKQRWRKISDEQRAKILRALIDVPKRKVWVTAPGGDEESKAYAAQINEVFLAAGLESDTGGMLAVTFTSGLSIFSDQPGNADVAAAIREAFKAADLICPDTDHNVLNDHAAISVMVGPR